MRNILVILIVTLLIACTEKEPGGQGPVTAQNKPMVVTSNCPLYFFSSEIAGDLVDVRFPSIEGDPAMWVPGGDEAIMLQSADLLILNGAGYESWLSFTTLSGENIVDTTANVQSMLLPIENTTVHQHGPQGKHSHQGTAFTTWLDPELAIEQSRSILQAVTQLKPDQAELFKTNFDQLEKRLRQLDQSLAQSFAKLAAQPVVFSHPVYQYLQHRYQINGRSLHWEPGIEPGTRDWIELGKLLQAHPAKLMVWEETPLDSTRGRLTEMGVQSVVFNPAANPGKPTDYFEMMNKNTDQITAPK